VSATLMTFALPPVTVLDSTRSVSILGVDAEFRFGVDSNSDVGLRVASLQGLVINYKRLLSQKLGAADVAVMPGIGVVNVGDHLHFELTLIASRRDETANVLDRTRRRRPRLFIPYGGVRVMQVAPIRREAVHDQPTAGGFIGARVGTLDLGISPEIGVFYDHSALGVRKSTVVVVPAVAVHGERLFDFLTRSGRARPRPRPRF
jgi:hypothetical protein